VKATIDAKCAERFDIEIFYQNGLFVMPNGTFTYGDSLYSHGASVVGAFRYVAT
jgi:hypothetical protein